MSGDKISQIVYENIKEKINEQYNNSISKNPEPIKKDNANLTMIVWGDPQISNYMFARGCCVKAGCEDLKNVEEPVDALILCGDIAENGFQSEYKMTASLINGVSDKFDHFIAMPGNHDVRLRRYKHQLNRFSDFLKTVNKSIGIDNRYYYSTTINGYKLIVMGTDKGTFEGAYISPEQLEFLDKEIAETQGTGKPVFVFNHQALKNTNGLPDTWQGSGKRRGSVGNQSDKIRSIFEKYDNVIFITGHLHYGTHKLSFEDCGKFKALSVQTIGAGNHGAYSKDAQGYVIRVYDDKVTFQARVFSENRYVERNVDSSFVTVKI